MNTTTDPHPDRPSDVARAIAAIDDDTPIVAGAAPLSEAEIDRLREELYRLVSDTRPTVAVEPIIHIQSRTRVGGEALARFPGSASTHEWFRTADALGLKTELEMRIIEEVVRNSQTGRGFISVNVSPDTLLDPRCLPLLKSADGAELVVEMTDHESVPSLSLLRPHLDAIRDAGVRVAVHVSSFGTDITRLLMLTNPDVVKLDPPLSASIVAGGQQHASARNFFSYCRRHGVFIVAVGVGDGDLPALHDAGADAVQGRQLSLG
ncbi:MAG: EAL domain-containing protein [Ilumatobacter sp.]|nr:EAL domain-containing protein [Ilumatobacter sp.]